MKPAAIGNLIERAMRLQCKDGSSAMALGRG
jgi:hypothetical protein